MMKKKQKLQDTEEDFILIGNLVVGEYGIHEQYAMVLADDLRDHRRAGHESIS